MFARVLASAAALALAGALPACSHDKAPQSYSEGIATLCDSPNHVPDGLTRAGQAQAIGRWADAHVTNGQARDFVKSLVTSGGSKSQILRKAATQAHVTPCALVDFWEASASPTSSPTSRPAGGAPEDGAAAPPPDQAAPSHGDTAAPPPDPAASE